MCSVFLSYARRDSEFALKLIRDLGSLGVAVWMDDHDVPGGSRWDEAIPDAVTGCSALLVVLSPESVKSHNVLDEVGLALDQGKRVLPVLFETCDIPFRLRRIQYIDCSREYARGLASLERALRAAELIPPANHSQSLTASNPLQKTFVVDGTLGWQATGVRLDRHDAAKIAYQQGTWRDPQTGERINPANLPTEIEECFDCLPVMGTTVAMGGLIAKIGEEILPFDALKNTLTGDGELFLRSNCCDEHLLEHCDGNVTVSIQVVPCEVQG
jgi:hypothetical protein